MPSRRRLLGLVAAGTLPFAGCLSAPSDADRTTTEPSTPSTTTEREPVRGGAAEASVERTITDEEYQYVESNDTVRYPATMAGDEVVEYDYEPFEEWGHIQGASVAAEYLRSLLDQRLPEAETLSVPVSSRGEQDGLRLVAALTTHLARDGDVLSEPSVSRYEVIRATPHTVDATIHFAGRTYTDRYPVYVEERTIQNE
ncbi:hypothetical protein LPA44_07420 [Halobacterium sp. KA-4]|jgi:hypothetical protein|uniref:hypothetical protein n=1 Tax=Halobacterium sp. KA-4 TaxID=2896367 RepID=UPI001E4DF943|nr:hypothetical protein [Halobacterium sp. KA-4]MCD2199724.1 hypothetical protein [Halobacterium sp. KA-4]